MRSQEHYLRRAMRERVMQKRAKLLQLDRHPTALLALRQDIQDGALMTLSRAELLTLVEKALMAHDLVGAAIAGTLPDFKPLKVAEVGSTPPG